MKKYLLLFLVFLIVVISSNKSIAQVLDGVYTPEHVPARKPIPYTFLREADVMWSKKIHRILDLKEKINHVLYYPTSLEALNKRYSLINLIVLGIKNQGLMAYEDAFFKNEITYDDVFAKLGAGVDTVLVYDPDLDEDVMTAQENEPKPEEILRVRIKEEWFFDRQRSVMEPRIVGLMPLRVFNHEETGARMLTPVCYIYFLEYRPLFARNVVFNPSNDAEYRTFDDIFMKRKFSSFIVQESNVYNNRNIADYRIGVDAILEGEKIKNWIFEFEHDLWEF